MKLVVTHAFGPYAVGDEITDPEIIQSVLETNGPQVVKTASPD